MSITARLRELIVKAFGRQEGEEAADLMASELLTTNGGTVGGDVTFSGDVTFNSAANYGVKTLTYAATVDLDFLDKAVQDVTLNGNIEFTTSNLAAGRSLAVTILADESERTFTFPAWVFVGTEPTVIAAGKTATLSLLARGSTAASVVAAYAVEA